MTGLPVRTIVVSGASRGIGLAIALRPARTTTGNLFADDEVLAEPGIGDLGGTPALPTPTCRSTCSSTADP